MTDLSNYAYQNRILLAQISQMLAQNMELFRSSSAPYANSTYRFPMGSSHPTMFAQLQNALVDTFGDGAGMIMQFAAAPEIRAGLGPIGDIIFSMMNMPQLGGVSDPGGFMLNRVSRNIGVGIPSVTVPFDFTDIRATDRYIAQRKSLANYAGQTEKDGPPTTLEQLRMGENNENLNKIIATRNAIRAQNEDMSFSNAFELFNAMNIYGPPINTTSLMTELSGISDEEAAKKFLSQASSRDSVDSLLSKASQASGLLGAINIVSRQLGPASNENAGIRGFLDSIKRTLNIGNDPRSFVPGVAQDLSTIGSLNIAMGVDDQGRNVPAVNALAVRLAKAIAPESSFTGMQALGFRDSRDLISTLSRSGMVSTGGVDVYGSLDSEDVKKMEEAMLKQLEGFSEIAKTGRRLGLKTDELIQNLQSIYGGRTNQVLNARAGEILEELETNVVDGVTEADRRIAEENKRRSSLPNPIAPITGEEERRQFLSVVAQKQAGTEIANELAKNVELGKISGIDAKGVMAMTATAAQILQNMGMESDKASILTQQALIYTGISRNNGRVPLTEAQSMAMVTGALAASTSDPSTRARSVLDMAIRDGTLDKDDPAVKALIERYTDPNAAPITEAEVSDLSGIGDRNYLYYLQGAEANIANIADEVLTNQTQRRLPEYFRNELKKTVNPENLDSLFNAIGDNIIPIFNDTVTAINAGKTNEEIKALLLDKYGLTEEKAQDILRVARNKNVQLGNLSSGTLSYNGLATLLEEEAQRQKTGMTSIEIFAEASSDFKTQVDALMTEPTAGANIKAGFDAIREAEYKRLIAQNPNMSEEEARKKANELEFTGEQYAEVLSGIGKDRAREALQPIKLNAEEELKNPKITEARKAVSEKLLEIIASVERAYSEKPPTTTAPDGAKEGPPVATGSSADSNKGSGTASKDEKGASTTSGAAATSDTAAAASTPDIPAAVAPSTANPTASATSSEEKPVNKENSSTNAEDLEDLKKTLDKVEENLAKIVTACQNIADRIIFSGI